MRTLALDASLRVHVHVRYSHSSWPAQARTFEPGLATSFCSCC